MTNNELAKRIIKNFLNRNPTREPEDFIKYRYCLLNTDCFSWINSYEGWQFWYSVYYTKFHKNDNLIRKFVKKYYFNVSKNFIYLTNIINNHFQTDTL